MSNTRTRFKAAVLVLSALTAPAPAQVFSSEFFLDAVAEGWELTVEYCKPQSWNEGGWYRQQLDLDACPPGPGGGRESFRRSLEPLNGVSPFSLEFRVWTDGDRSEIPGGAPTVVAMGNFFGVSYHVTVSQDLVQFLRDVELPIWLIEIDPGVPHTYRVELYPDWYSFYIDAELIDEGVPEGPFPAHDSVITWRGRSWYLPCENAWDYIRYGVIPVDGSGDYDSDGAVSLDDFYFFHECLTNDRAGIHGGPEQNSGPGCAFVDFDADGDTDLLDFAAFQNMFTSAP